jgi:hypothetical protein
MLFLPPLVYVGVDDTVLYNDTQVPWPISKRASIAGGYTTLFFLPLSMRPAHCLKLRVAVLPHLRLDDDRGGREAESDAAGPGRQEQRLVATGLEALPDLLAVLDPHRPVVP